MEVCARTLTGGTCMQSRRRRPAGDRERPPLPGAPHGVNQACCEPVRHRLPRRGLLQDELTGELPQLVDDLSECDEMRLRL